MTEDEWVELQRGMADSDKYNWPEPEPVWLVGREPTRRDRWVEFVMVLLAIAAISCVLLVILALWVELGL